MIFILPKEIDRLIRDFADIPILMLCHTAINLAGLWCQEEGPLFKEYLMHKDYSRELSKKLKIIRSQGVFMPNDLNLLTAKTMLVDEIKNSNLFIYEYPDLPVIEYIHPFWWKERYDWYRKILSVQ